MNVEGNKLKTIEYIKLDKSFLHNNNNNEICILKNDIDYYFKLNLKKTCDKVVVFSNGAADRKKSELPIFMRHSWSDEVNASCIYVDDRTIHDSRLMIGWGIGRKNVHHLNEVGMILRKILLLLEIPSNKSFYYGSSAGGMMAAYFSIKHKCSKAIVNNPQMITSNYMDGKALSFIRNNFFKEYSQEDFIERFKDRLSIPYIIKEDEYIPRMLYILNKLSETDYECQYLPFIKELDDSGLDASNIEYLLYNNKRLGHNPLPKERTIKIINAVLEGLF